MSAARLLVFLGNPGPEYARTRHNAAWLLADSLSFAPRLTWRRKFKGVTAALGDLLLLKPETLMNASGESVQACARFHRLDAPRILVVHDDIELDFGRSERKSGGGLGGHNGLRDIARALGTRDFERFRLGVGRPGGSDVAAYVLSRFSAEEQAELSGYLVRAAGELESYLQAEGFGILS